VSIQTNGYSDARRYIRPFFLTSDGKPLPSKIFYDIFTCFMTQINFSFISIPFLLLQIGPTMQVWGNVYYYELILAFGAMAVFASPVKGMLAKRVKAMSRPGVQRIKSEGPDVMLGVPGDPEQEIQDIASEIRAEIERRKGEGLPVPDVKVLVNEKLAQMKQAQESQQKKEL
jgi:lysophospholipid acyltransferase